MHRSLCLILSLLLTSLFLPASEWKLTVDGKSNCSIVLPKTPNAGETMAQKELDLFIRKISGTTLSGGTYRIRLTLASDAPADMKKKLDAASSRDAFYMKTVGNELIIAGKTHKAELYGVYNLLEKYIGCRWFYPGDLGEYLPQTNEIKIPGTIDDFQEPSFYFRRLCWANIIYGHRCKVDSALWLIRNRMDTQAMGPGGSLYPEQDEAVLASLGGGGHLIWYEAVPWKKYYKEHPEYYSLWNGKREIDGQCCLSQPEVKRLLTETVLKYVSKRDGRHMYSFGVPDWGHQCHCDSCVQKGMYKGVFYINQALHGFYSEVCDEVFKKVPDAEIWVDFYVDRTPPANPNFRYDKRVHGTYNAHQSCYAHNLFDPECRLNAKILSEMKGWRDRGAMVNFRGYFDMNNAFYAPLELTLAGDLKYLKKEGFDGWWDEIQPPGGTYYAFKNTEDVMISCWPFFYMAAKLLWNVDQNPRKIIEDAFQKYYGPAAKPMLEARDYKQRLWDSAPGHATYNGPFRLGHCFNIPGAAQRMVRYFDQAEKMAGNDQRLINKITLDRVFLQKWGLDKAAELNQTASGRNSFPMRRRQKPIVVDGVLDEPDWRKAEIISDFKIIADGNTPTEETRVKILYDKDTIYISMDASMERAWSKPTAVYTKRDEGKICLDDSVEFFIMPPGQTDTYWHWMVNCIGTVYDAVNPGGAADTSFNTTGKIAVKKLPRSYVLEAAIPVSDLGLTSIIPGQQWRFHFVRGCTNLQPPSSNEGISINAIKPHDYSRWWPGVPGRQIFTNGTFGIIGPRPKSSKSVSQRFPVDWGGARAALRSDGKVSVQQGGHLGRYVRFSPEGGHFRLTVEVRLQGRGKVSFLTRTNCGKDARKRQRPGGGEHRQEVVLKPVEGMQSIRMVKDIAPYEEGYFFLFNSYPNEPIVVESVIGTLEKLEGK